MDDRVGFIGWRIPVIAKTDENDETATQSIWPKKQARTQALRHVGERRDLEPALLTCSGACGKQHVKWTWHKQINSASFQCVDCGASRRWGLGFGYNR